MKHTTPTLFGPEIKNPRGPKYSTLKRALARADDPTTSHAAASRVTASGQLATNTAKVVAAVKAHPGRTSAELAPLAGLDRVETARRCSSAEERGLIVKGPVRACSTNGHKAVTWTLRAANAAEKDRA